MKITLKPLLMVLFIGGQIFAFAQIGELPEKQKIETEDLTISVKSYKRSMFLFKSIGGVVKVKSKKKKRRWWCGGLCKTAVKIDADLIQVTNNYYTDVNGYPFLAMNKTKRLGKVSTCRLKESAFGFLKDIKVPSGYSSPQGSGSGGLLPLSGVVSYSTVELFGEQYNFETAKGIYPVQNEWLLLASPGVVWANKGNAFSPALSLGVQYNRKHISDRRAIYIDGIFVKYGYVDLIFYEVVQPENRSACRPANFAECLVGDNRLNAARETSIFSSHIGFSFGQNTKINFEVGGGLRKEKGSDFEVPDRGMFRSYDNVSPVVDYGVGLDIPIKGRLSLSLKYQQRKTFFKKYEIQAPDSDREIVPNLTTTSNMINLGFKFKIVGMK